MGKKMRFLQVLSGSLFSTHSTVLVGSDG